MKNGLLLTLKQLIKLGVIKIKKRRKNKNKRLQQIDAFEKGITKQKRDLITLSKINRNGDLNIKKWKK